MNDEGGWAFDNGFIAALTGKPASANPYTYRQATYHRWAEGYLCGLMEDQFLVWARGQSAPALAFQAGKLNRRSARRFYLTCMTKPTDTPKL